MSHDQTLVLLYAIGTGLTASLQVGIEMWRAARHDSYLRERVYLAWLGLVWPIGLPVILALNVGASLGRRSRSKAIQREHLETEQARLLLDAGVQ